MGQIGNRAVVVTAALLGVVAMLLALPAAGMAKRTYSSPGYTWNRKLPKVAPVIPGKLIKLGDGAYPHVLVDAAGTGQIAYTTEPEDGPSVLRDCVLMRGQTGCATNSGLIPNEPGGPPLQHRRRRTHPAGGRQPAADAQPPLSDLRAVA